MRLVLPSILAAGLIASLALAAPPAGDRLPDVSSAAPGRPEATSPAEPAALEQRVPLVSSAGFEPRAAHGEY
jgi:hypothetical protein